MSTFIFTWNPKVLRLDIGGLLKLKTKLEKGKDTVNEWQCLSYKMIKKGDRAFISKVGRGSRGLFASGVVVSESYDYNDKKYVYIKFDFIFDPNENIYEISELNKDISDKPKLWNPQSSGIPIPSELEAILENCWSKFIEDEEEKAITKNKNLSDTEKRSLVKSRIGQGKFREDVVGYWNKKCSVTGCSLTNILIASHIKPWKLGNNDERLERFNGLLLTPNLDKLFDSGKISFTDDGEILISLDLTEKDKKTLGINNKMKLCKVSRNHKKYLSFHRNMNGF